MDKRYASPVNEVGNAGVKGDMAPANVSGFVELLEQRLLGTLEALESVESRLGGAEASVSKDTRRPCILERLSDLTQLAARVRKAAEAVAEKVGD